MKSFLYSVIACLLLCVTFSCTESAIVEPEISTEESVEVQTFNLANAATERSNGNAAAVEICKEIVPLRPDFDNLGQCVKLMAVCGDFDTSAANFPVCICEIFELNGLLEIFGFENYGQCVSSI